jgi:hypothetical protein
MRCIALTLTLVATFGAHHAARGDDLVAVSPGVMCSSAEALAHLTFPDGRSRTGVQKPSPRDLDVARRGGCIDIPYGARIFIYRSYRNTSLGIFDGADGRGPREFIIPNINFRPLPGSGGWIQSGTGMRLMAPPPRPFTLDYFFSALERECPDKAWRGARSEVLYTPLERAIASVPSEEQRQLNAETARQCAGNDGVTCGPNAAIPFMLRAGRLEDLVRSYCAAEPG